MPKFRKKPVVIEAVQVRPAILPDIDPGNIPFPVKPWPDEHGAQPRDMSMGYIDTLEGRFHVHYDDWIITGIKGEHYSCKPDIFEATYEPVSP